jgi:hypothetical protein
MTILSLVLLALLTSFRCDVGASPMPVNSNLLPDDKLLFI